MLKHLTEKEIEFCENFYNSRCLVESTFSKGTPRNWNDKKPCIRLRTYQRPFLGFDSVLEDDDRLKEEENFQRRIKVGTRIIVSGRKIGKTFVGLTANILLKLIHYKDLEMTMASYDEKHVSKVMDSVKEFMSYHNFYKCYKQIIRGSPEYLIETKNGNKLFGINETVKGKNPGECVDEQTEVLTDSGWKFFKDLTYFDKVLSLNNKREGVYCKIKKIFKHQYNGIMKKIHNKNSEFLVTPNHKLIVEEHGVLKYKSLDRDSFFKQIYMSAVFDWNGKNKKIFKLSGISNFRYAKYITTYKNWVKFIAWYLSEGCLVNSKDSHYRISISQKKNCEQIEHLLEDMNLKYYKNEHDNGCFNYVINNKLIYNHLNKYFGKIKTKIIAPYFKNLSKDLLKIFVEEYLKCDGTVKYHKNRKNPYKGLCTSLKKLADDLQEVSQKAGFKTKITIDRCRKNSFGKEPIYWITLCRTTNSVFQRDTIEDVNYNGNIYCVNTEPYHNIFIRRNGSVIWTSNSWWGHHTFINFQDEIQAETEAAYTHKIDAVSDFGVMEILCGIPLISKVSPLGRTLRDKTLKRNLIRLPQYVNYLWNELTKERRIRDYGGEESAGYRINVAADLIEGACISEGTKILMSDFSTKNIEDIVIGEDILTFSEKAPRRFVKSKIINTLYKGNKDTVTIDNGFSTLTLTPDHKLLADYRKALSWRETKDCILKNRKVISFKYYINNIEDYKKGLLLGFIETDATKQFDKNSEKYSIYITQTVERKALEKIMSDLGVTYCKYDIKNERGNRYCVKRMNNVNIEEWYHLLDHNRDIQLGFLSGFILGDGWVDGKNLRITQKNIKKELILEKILTSLNINYAKHVRKNGCKIYTISRFELPFYCDDSIKTKKHLKYLLKTLTKTDYCKHNIKQINSGKVNVFDLTTTSGTFIANGFLVHNCGAFDMERVKANYNRKRSIKRFEITKKNFKDFKSLLVIEPIINADRVYVTSDIGDAAATEINIFARINKKYHLIYNITTYRLSLTRELPDLMEWIFKTVKANYISCDCTIMGKPVHEILSERLDEKEINEKGEITKIIKRVYWCAFNEDLVTGFVTDDKGKAVCDGKGNPSEKKESTIVFAVKRLNELFFDKKFDIPEDDYKFDNQFSSYVSTLSGNKILYGSTTEDHYVQSFQVFAILEWNTEQLPTLSTIEVVKKPGLGAFS